MFDRDLDDPARAHPAALSAPVRGRPSLAMLILVGVGLLLVIGVAVTVPVACLVMLHKIVDDMMTPRPL